MLAEDERPGFLTFCTVKGAPYGLMFLPNTGANRDQVPVCNLNNYVMMVVLEKKTCQMVRGAKVELTPAASESHR